MLRENDLIWSFFVKDYLLGQEPTPFDILYWNSNSTNMPAAMHTYYLRNMYLYNRMRDRTASRLQARASIRPRWRRSFSKRSSNVRSSMLTRLGWRLRPTFRKISGSKKPSLLRRHAR